MEPFFTQSHPNLFSPSEAICLLKLPLHNKKKLSDDLIAFYTVLWSGGKGDGHAYLLFFLEKHIQRDLTSIRSFWLHERTVVWVIASTLVLACDTSLQLLRDEVVPSVDLWARSFESKLRVFIIQISPGWDLQLLGSLCHYPLSYLHCLVDRAKMSTESNTSASNYRKTHEHKEMKRKRKR